MRVAVVTEPIDPRAEVSAFERQNGDIGASVSFVGRCRMTSKSGAVTALELQHYSGFTEEIVTNFVSEQLAHHAGSDAIFLHRVGAIAPGEAIVLVAAVSSHRAAAFALVETIMDFLKTDAPFWKRERTASGWAWVEPTRDDHERRASAISKP